MDNQAWGFKIGKRWGTLSQTRKQKNAKRELENARQKERKPLKKTGTKDPI